jgi:hypothetical protein
LKDRALVAYQGIADALGSGDIGLAAQVLWLALKVEWQRGVQYLEGIWLGFKDTFLSVAVDAFYGAVKVLAGAWHGLRAVWVETISFLFRGWTAFTAGLQSAFRAAQLKVEEGLHHIMGLLDSTYDVNQAIEIARTTERADQGKIEQQREQDLQQSDRQRERDLGRIGSDFEAQQQALDQAAEQVHQQRRDLYQQQIDESMAALEDARRQYRSALSEAAQKRSAQADEAGPSAAEQFTEDLKKRLAGLGDTIDEVGKRTVDVRGTFNARALLSLQSGESNRQLRAVETSAKATTETARNTRELVRRAASGLTFD